MPRPRSASKPRRSDRGTARDIEREALGPLTLGGGVWRAFATRSRTTRWMMLLAAVAVMGAYLHAPRMKPSIDAPQVLELAQNNMSVLHQALLLYRRDCGTFPSTRAGLAALVHNPDQDGWQGPYILKLKPDPWGRPFGYESDGERFQMSSPGPDGVAGSPDDLRLSATGDAATSARGWDLDVSIEATTPRGSAVHDPAHDRTARAESEARGSAGDPQRDRARTVSPR